MNSNEKTARARILETITNEQWAAIVDFAKERVDFQEKTKRKETKSVGQDELYFQLSDILKEMGVPTNIKGYYYLREAVVLVYQRYDYINAVTKELYPEIAKKFTTTASKVERAIRHGIGCALDRGDYDAILKYFKSIPLNANLTNSQFIATIADYLKKGKVNV